MKTAQKIVRSGSMPTSLSVGEAQDDGVDLCDVFSRTTVTPVVALRMGNHLSFTSRPLNGSRSANNNPSVAVAMPVPENPLSDVATCDTDSTPEMEMAQQQLQAALEERNRILERRRQHVVPAPEGSDDETPVETTSGASIESSPSETARETSPFVRSTFVGFLLVLLLSLMVPAALIIRRSPPAPTRAENVTKFLNDVTLSGLVLNYDPNSTVPEDQALVWLIDEDPLQLTPANSSQLIRRFVFLTVWFQLGIDFILPRFEFDECDVTAQVFWTCDEQGNIRDITFANLALSGTIPRDVGLLPTISGLSIEGNGGTGTIPTEIGLLTHLERLSLSRNQFSGTIPTEIGALTNLVELLLSGNKLHGSIPLEISQLSGLKQAWFHNNLNLTGSMPVCENSLDPFVWNTTENILTADCDRVGCACCSFCCPDEAAPITTVAGLACDIP